MKENIETKDVQRTEYLDKNGLDMLWAKVKENTHNQVEVEYNRAKAEEDSLSQEIASVKPDEGKSYIQAKLTSKEQDGDICYYDVAGDISFKSEYSDSYSGPITIINKNGIGINFDNDATFGSTGSLNVKKDSNYNITMQGNGRLLHDTRDTFNQVSIQLLDNVDTTYANSSNGNSILISQLGIFYTSQGYALTSNDLLTGHGGYKTIGTDITPLENGKVPAEYLDLSQYAKKTDIPEVDTSNFVSKTTTDNQIINSPLCINNEVIIADNMEDENTDFVNLTPTELQFSENNYTSSINLRGKAMDFDIESGIEIKTSHENPYITLYSGTKGTNTDESSLEITNSGISINSSQNENSGPDKVFATDGSIADLTQYVKKGEITAGGNVDDVQVNGVSVVENKIANIKPATKESLGVVKVGDGLNVTDGTISVDSAAIGAGNYIPYESIDDHTNYKVYITKHNEGILFDAGSDSVSISRGEMIIKNTVRKLSLTSGFIWLQEISDNGNRESLLVELDKNGLRLRGGDNNHVLTSYGSTIDITRYALKSELPTVPTKVSQLQNDSEFITKSVYDEKIAALEARIAALEAKHTETA